MEPEYRSDAGITPPRTAPSIRALCEFFWAEEARLDLIDASRAGSFWAAVRMPLYYALLKELGLGQEPHVARGAKLPFAQRLRSRFDTEVLHNPWLTAGARPHVIVEHARVDETSPHPADRYTSDFFDEFREADVAFASLTAPYAGLHRKPLNARRFATDAVEIFTRVRRRVDPQALPSTLRRRIDEFSRDLRTAFGLDWTALPIAEGLFAALSARTAVYQHLFEHWSTEELIIAVGYGRNVAIIDAAHRVGAKVREVQHGTFSRYHLGYSYPDRSEKIPGFPDELLVWSESWARRVPFSTRVAEVTVKAQSWVAKEKLAFADARKEKIALVVSQGVLGDQIARELWLRRDRLKNYRIIYKLHPGEVGRHTSYEHLKMLEEAGLVEVVTAGSLAAELSRAAVVVGVFSTAIYEALDFGCRVFLLPLPGLEYMSDVLEAKQAELLAQDGPAL